MLPKNTTCFKPSQMAPLKKYHVHTVQPSLQTPYRFTVLHFQSPTSWHETILHLGRIVSWLLKMIQTLQWKMYTSVTTRSYMNISLAYCSSQLQTRLLVHSAGSYTIDDVRKFVFYKMQCSLVSKKQTVSSHLGCKYGHLFLYLQKHFHRCWEYMADQTY